MHMHIKQLAIAIGLLCGLTTGIQAQKCTASVANKVGDEITVALIAIWRNVSELFGVVLVTLAR
jgi:hypothetical protein